MDGLQSLYTPHTVPEIIPLSIPPQRLTRKSDLIVIPNDRPVSRDGLQVTEAEFMADWYDAPDIIYEWCNGILEEKPVSDMEGELMGHWFIRLLNLVIETCAPAHLTATNIGFRLAFSGHASIRRPDLAVVLSQNPVGIGLKDVFYDGIYNLCVEFLSHSKPSGVLRDTVQKKEEYARTGVQEYYILDSHRKETAFYRLNDEGVYQSIPPVNGDIIQSQVLPEFQFRIRDIYGRPSLETLMRDPVYQHYVLPGYQKAVQRAEETESLLMLEKQRAEQADLRARQERQRARQERQRAEQANLKAEQEKQRAEQANLKAEQEKQRAEQANLKAEQEKQRAEKLAARLKALGISPVDLA